MEFCGRLYLMPALRIEGVLNQLSAGTAKVKAA